MMYGPPVKGKGGIQGVGTPPTSSTLRTKENAKKSYGELGFSEKNWGKTLGASNGVAVKCTSGKL